MRARWLAKILRGPLKEVCARRKPDLEITNNRAPGEIYLKRWHVFSRGWWPNIYIHHMLMDDEAVPHDHPYASLSLVLEGMIMEKYSHDPAAGHYSTRYLRAGALAYRPRYFAHRLLVSHNPRGCWTMFMVGPRVKDWGFWCSTGFVHYKEFWRRRDEEFKAGGIRGALAGCGEI